MPRDRGPLAWMVLALLGCAGVGHVAEPSVTSVTEPADGVPAEDMVRRAFANYVDALEARDGAKAARLVTPESIDYYAQTLRAARELEAEALRTKSAAQQLAVLTVRLRFSPAELESMTGDGLFVTSVERGWVGRHIVSATLRDVEVSAETATIRLEMSDGSLGEPIPAYRRVAGQWSFDLTQMLPHAEQAIDRTLARMIEGGGLTPEAALVQILQKIVDRPVDASVWKPAG